VSAVCVFCGSSDDLEAGWLELAFQVGEQLARRGHRVVSGGGRVGMMGTLAKGARSAGGYTLGIIPKGFIEFEIADLDADELVETDGLSARKTVMIDRSDGFLILPGGLGTLDELFEVWTTATLGLHSKPIVVLDLNGVYKGLFDWLDTLVQPGFVRPTARSAVRVVSSLDEALDAVDDFG